MTGFEDCINQAYHSIDSKLLGNSRITFRCGICSMALKGDMPKKGRHGGLMVSELDSGSSSPGSSPVL